MPKYQVTGTFTQNFDVEVEADDEDEAVEIVEDMDFDDLADGGPMPKIEVDGILELK
jgi:hypothetical protein